MLADIHITLYLAITTLTCIRTTCLLQATAALVDRTHPVAAGSPIAYADYVTQ